jgi:uncharacterized protein (TIGR02145 family)
MKTLRIRIVNLVMMTMICFLYVLPFTLNAQQEGTFRDSRDNRVYQWNKIGKKIWMAENLKFQAKSGSWVYNNDSVNLESFGRLYDWSTASTACPKGWLLPTDLDWGALMNTYGGRDAAGGKLQENDSINRKINKKVTETGKTLSTLLGGIRHGDGTYTGLGLWGGFWSATSTSDGAKNYLFAHADKSISISSNDKNSAFSVRCVKK